MVLLIILAIVVLLVIFCVSLYNNLVRLRNNRENAFANIDVQLKQRHDLIPQLVATVKGYAEHEKEVFMRVTEARSAAMKATTVNEKVQAVLHKAKFDEMIGADNICSHINIALDRARQLI